MLDTVAWAHEERDTRRHRGRNPKRETERDSERRRGGGERLVNMIQTRWDKRFESFNSVK